VLTDKNHPVARMMYEDLKGHALVRFHSVSLTYPIENPKILSDLVRHELRDASESDDVWVVDAQTAVAVGTCLGEGLPLHERLVVTGGPAAVDPRHYHVRIGTPLESFIKPVDETTLLLRGGVLTGRPVSDGVAAVGYDDDAYFALPRTGKSDVLGFARPGFAKTSYTRSFAGRLFGGFDRNISATLRGEERPCIACGLCETVCPAGIMPQIIHRYLYRGRTEEAEKAGLGRCVDCNLCTYVCPSKIELQRQFSEAKELVRREREEMLAVAAKSEASAATSTGEGERL
ncbi:MAG TPA: 4Fe-4S dicluster domain-containing protein, partial [Spirochaetia bacterium]|nr:4Fe-4S dicluster domain-containing protein [Spirochaetia bacterium]